MLDAATQDLEAIERRSLLLGLGDQLRVRAGQYNPNLSAFFVAWLLAAPLLHGLVDLLRGEVYSSASANGPQWGLRLLSSGLITVTSWLLLRWLKQRALPGTLDHVRSVMAALDYNVSRNALRLGNVGLPETSRVALTNQALRRLNDSFWQKLLQQLRLDYIYRCIQSRHEAFDHAWVRFVLVSACSLALLGFGASFLITNYLPDTNYFELCLSFIQVCVCAALIVNYFFDDLRKHAAVRVLLERLEAELADSPANGT